MMFVGMASIPFTYRFASGLGFGLSAFYALMISMVSIGFGFLLMYVNYSLQKVAVYEIDNAQSGNIPPPTPDVAANMLKRIEITINDNCITLSTEGLSPQETIASLELTKHYVISKQVRNGLPMDVVRRK
jgi:hypothetical protein